MLLLLTANSGPPALSKPSEKPKNPPHLRVDIRAGLAQAPWCHPNGVKEANSPDQIFIQDYNVFNRNPKGLSLCE